MRNKPTLAELMLEAGQLYDEYWLHTDIGYNALNHRNKRDYGYLTARYRDWCQHGRTVGTERILLRRKAKWYVRFYTNHLGRIKHLEHRRPLVSRYKRVQTH
jgi:hypothetical protein